MKRKCLATDRSFVGKEGGEATATNQLSEEVISGEFIWVRLHGSSWWPAQAVDENTVSGGNKPINRSAGEVLVRLYGSYKYMYVDPMKFRSEFENILKQHNGSFSEVLKRTLELDLHRFRSGRSKGKGSKSEEHAVATSMENASENGASKRRSIMKIDNLTSVRISPRRLSTVCKPKTVTKDNILLPQKPEAKEKNGYLLSKKAEATRSKSAKKNVAQATTPVGKSQELSARRMRVMQSLGLIAPSGSPFHQNGHICN